MIWWPPNTPIGWVDWTGLPDRGRELGDLDVLAGVDLELIGLVRRSRREVAAGDDRRLRVDRDHRPVVHADEVERRAHRNRDRRRPAGQLVVGADRDVVGAPGGGRQEESGAGGGCRAAAVGQHLVDDDREVGRDVERVAASRAAELGLGPDRRRDRARDVERERERVGEEHDRDRAGLDAGEGVVGLVLQALALTDGDLGVRAEVDARAGERDLGVDRGARRVRDEHRVARVVRWALRRVHVDGVVLAADRRVVRGGGLARIGALAGDAREVLGAQRAAALAVDDRRAVLGAAWTGVPAGVVPVVTGVVTGVVAGVVLVARAGSASESGDGECGESREQHSGQDNVRHGFSRAHATADPLRQGGTSTVVCARARSNAPGSRRRSLSTGVGSHPTWPRGGPALIGDPRRSGARRVRARHACASRTA